MLLVDVIRRDRLIVAAGIVLLVLLAWAYTLSGAGMGMSAFEMTAMTPAPGKPGMTMPAPEWTLSYGALMFAMWSVMMVAMMLPSATPMILVFERVHRRQDAAAGMSPTWFFVLGYIIAWTGFSLLATILQWVLATNGLISPMLASSSARLAGALLIGAGIYQMTPIKHACLKQCRGPAAFIAGHWRAGRNGALRMGLEHGAICLGCCWALMVLLFVGGVMNLYWIGGLAVIVLLEKTLPRGQWFGIVSGLALLGWGVTLLL